MLDGLKTWKLDVNNLCVESLTEHGVICELKCTTDMPPMCVLLRWGNVVGWGNVAGYETGINMLTDSSYGVQILTIQRR